MVEFSLSIAVQLPELRYPAKAEEKGEKGGNADQLADDVICVQIRVPRRKRYLPVFQGCLMEGLGLPLQPS